MLKDVDQTLNKHLTQLAFLMSTDTWLRSQTVCWMFTPNILCNQSESLDAVRICRYSFLGVQLHQMVILWYLLEVEELLQD